jgi:hypothetical protein
VAPALAREMFEVLMIVISHRTVIGRLTGDTQAEENSSPAFVERERVSKNLSRQEV